MLARPRHFEITFAGNAKELVSAPCTAIDRTRTFACPVAGPPLRRILFHLLSILLVCAWTVCQGALLSNIVYNQPPPVFGNGGPLQVEEINSLSVASAAQQCAVTAPGRTRPALEDGQMTRTGRGPKTRVEHSIRKRENAG